MSWVLMYASRAKLADDRRTFLNSLRVRLYQNNVDPITPGMTLGAFVPCDFPGYSDRTAVWRAGYLNAVNNGETDADQLVWTCSGSSPSNSIYGVVLFDPGTMVVVAAQGDPQGPVVVNGAGQQYKANLVWQVGQGPC